MSDTKTILEAFFGSGGGTVVYKAYRPRRGDDIHALVELGRALPWNVDFQPMSPGFSLLADLRGWLQQTLVPERRVEWTDEVRAGSELELRHILSQVLPPSRFSADQSVEELLAGFGGDPEVLRAILLDMVATTVFSPDDPYRTDLPLPDDVPILVVGRPEHFLSYKLDGEDGPLSDFSRVLQEAGYPNRFEFMSYDADTLGKRDVADRQTARIWPFAGRSKVRTPSGIEVVDEDVGFLFAGRTAQGQPIMVATGSSALGTHAAVRLLVQQRSVLAPVIRELAEPASRRRVDIGFRCTLRQLPNTRPYPLACPADCLRIDFINQDDLVGYDWAREASASFHPVTSLWKGPDAEGGELSRVECPDECLEWKVAGPRRIGVGSEASRLVRVEVSGEAWQIDDKRRIFASQPLAGILRSIYEELRADRQDWAVRLEGVEFGSKGVKADFSFETFRPVLLLGPTGAGKELLALFIARGWRGARLHANDIRTALGNQKRLVQDWIRGVPRMEESLLTFNAMAFPSGVRDAALFGAEEGSFTDAVERPGVFLAAGTGILFLDELLELPLEEQARLLVALQQGRVAPLGSRGEAHFYFCRIVAATNKVPTPEELREAIRKGHIREDLAARFTESYRVPALSERSLEVLPILIELLREGRAPGAPRLHLRISDPAFQALVTYGFPGGVRDLKRLADTLPAELVQSFRRSWSVVEAEEEDATLDAHAIRLQHLAALDPSNLGRRPRAGDCPWKNPKEHNFYEFTVGEPSICHDPAELGPSREVLIPAATSRLDERGLERFLEWVRGKRAELGVVNSRAHVIFTPRVRRIEDFAAFLNLPELEPILIGAEGVYREIHGNRDLAAPREGGHLVNKARIGAWSRDGRFAEIRPLLPLGPIPMSEDGINQRYVEVFGARMEELCPGRKGPWLPLLNLLRGQWHEKRRPRSYDFEEQTA